MKQRVLEKKYRLFYSLLASLLLSVYRLTSSIIQAIEFHTAPSNSWFEGKYCYSRGHWMPQFYKLFSLALNKFFVLEGNVMVLIF